jgi:methionyl-tRNA formyltransferase
MRIVFMGTPDFAATALNALIAAGHEIAAVYCQKPRPAGRGQALRKSPVQELAERNGLTVRCPTDLKAPEVQKEFQALGADVAVVAAYGLILPKSVLTAPRLGCVNIHASLLPRWRGAAPIQRALLAGDAETGIAIMRMDEGLDTGPVLLVERMAIAPGMNAGALHERLAELGARLIVEALPRLASGSLVAKAQSGAGITYAAKISPAEARLDWRRPAEELARMVRAFNPAPGAWCELSTGERLKILSAEAIAGGGAPGTIIDEAPTIACGSGALRLVAVQRAGKRAMAGAEFLRGAKLKTGDVLK